MKSLPSLLFLYALLTIATFVNGFNYYIDLDRCKTKEMTCFFRQSCVDSTKSSDTLEERSGPGIESLKSKMDGCDIIVQMKPFSRSKIQIMMQVNRTTENLISAFGIKLRQGTTQFGCYQKGSNANSSFKAASLGERQIFNDELMFCSFTVEVTKKTADGSLAKITSIFENDEGRVNLVYSTVAANNEAKKYSISFESDGDSFWRLPDSCNPDDIFTNDSVSGKYILNKVDTAYSEMRCDSAKGTLKMNITSLMFPISRIYCQGRKYAYITETDHVENVLPLGTEFRLYCATKFCSLCPDLGYKTCIGCFAPEILSDHSCRAAKCPSHNDSSSFKWRLDDGSLTDSIPQCKRNTKDGQSETAGWFITVGSESREITEGSCQKLFDCPTTSNLKFSCPSKNDCVEANQSPGSSSINCSAGYDLKFGDETGSILTCNVDDGRYYDSGRVAPLGANVYCQKKPSSAALQTGSFSMSTGLSIGGGALVLIIIVVIVIVVVRRRRAVKTKTEAPNTEGAKTAMEIVASNPSVPSVPTDSRPRKKASPTNSEKERLVKMDAKLVLVQWDTNLFLTAVVYNIHLFSTPDLLYFCYQLTHFAHHSGQSQFDTFGTLWQFFSLFHIYKKHAMRCAAAWEVIFRVMKILYCHVPMPDDREIKKRMAALVKYVGEDNAFKYQFRMEDDEEIDKSMMRMVAVRMCMWLGEETNCTEEVKKSAEYKPEELDPSMRMPVLSYAVNQLNKEEELKQFFYEEVKKAKEEWMKNKKLIEVLNKKKNVHSNNESIGSMREHLLFALCSSQSHDPNGELITLKEIMEVIHEKDPKKRLAPFTPTDHLYAFRGATEDPAAWPVVFELFKKHALTNVAEFIKPITDKYPKTPAKEYEEVMKGLREDCIKLCTLMYECAIGLEQHEVIVKICAPYLEFAKSPKLENHFKERAIILKTFTCYIHRGDWIDEGLELAIPYSQ